MSIFKQIDFTSHSGKNLSWKIVCDDLTDEDIDTLAYIVSQKSLLFSFNDVIGVPSGGMKFAKALKPYINKKAKHPLIVDDVLTTGKSMNETRKKFPKADGIVIFSRKIFYPTWIFPIFILNDAIFGTFNKIQR